MCHNTRQADNLVINDPKPLAFHMYSSSDYINTFESVPSPFYQCQRTRAWLVLEMQTGHPRSGVWGRAALSIPAVSPCTCSCTKNYHGTGQNQQAWKSQTAWPKDLGMSSPSLQDHASQSLIPAKIHIYIK